MFTNVFEMKWNLLKNQTINIIQRVKLDIHKNFKNITNRKNQKNQIKTNPLKILMKAQKIYRLSKFQNHLKKMNYKALMIYLQIISINNNY